MSTVEFKSDDSQKEEYQEIRIFTRKQKEECWNQADIIEGRDPNRWRYDAVGNPVLKYDHITPFSKGGKTEVSNCQLLQSFLNIFKSNKILTKEELISQSPRKTRQFTTNELDVIEIAVYGNIEFNEDSSKKRKNNKAS